MANFIKYALLLLAVVAITSSSVNQQPDRCTYLGNAIQALNSFLDQFYDPGLQYKADVNFLIAKIAALDPACHFPEAETAREASQHAYYELCVIDPNCDGIGLRGYSGGTGGGGNQHENPNAILTLLRENNIGLNELQNFIKDRQATLQGPHSQPLLDNRLQLMKRLETADPKTPLNQLFSADELNLLKQQPAPMQVLPQKQLPRG